MDTKLIRHSLRQLVANKVRLALTSFAIVISVAFVSASFTLSVGIGDVIFGWGETQVAGLDLVVEPESPFAPQNFEVNPARVDDETLRLVESVDGVADARPALWTNFLFRPTTPEGLLLEDRFNVSTYGWVEGSNFVIVEGAAPGAGEFTLDEGTVAANDYVVGDTYEMSTPTQTRKMRLSGVTRYREEGGTTAGQAVQNIALDELQTELGETGYVNIHVDVEEGFEPEAIQDSIQRAVPEGLVVRTQDEARAIQRDLIAPFAQGFAGALIGFGALSLFVACFIIYNTFSVLMQQRTQEIGLLRAIGASPKQLRTAIQFEAMALGLTCAVFGIGAGLGISWAISELFHRGAGFPRPDLTLTPLTIVVSLVVGTTATLIAVTGPARKACSVPVVAALRNTQTGQRRTAVKRFVIGSALTLVGLGAIVAGLIADVSTQSTVLRLGLGAVAVFIGVALLNSLWIAPSSHVLGAPLAALTKVPGELARGNIARNRSRSASTAAALMIGLALVSMVLVVGESFKATAGQGADSAYKSDNILFNQSGYKYPISVADKLEALPEVDQTVAISIDLVEIDGRVEYITIADQRTASDLIDFDVRQGAGYSNDVANPVVVTEREAADKGIAVGDQLTTRFYNGETAELTVIGINRNNAAGGNSYYIDRATWQEQTGQTTVDIVAVQSSESATDAQFESAIDDFERANAQVNVETIEDFVKSTEQTINSSLQAINVMMFLAILISFLGITNTLALSISERTKEMGLLRAVGMRRKQLRKALRYEALLISLFGSLVGVVLGIGFGVVSVVAIPPTVAEAVYVPATQIAVLVMLASVASVVAAAVPAWRASRRNPLDLITA